jgi:hypothetical protein
VIVGKIAAGAATAAANVGNTGNGTMSAPSDQVGAHTVEFISPIKFNVYGPFGNLVGEGTAGVAFANQIGFAISAGATPFAASDGFAVTVAVNADAGLIVR